MFRTFVAIGLAVVASRAALGSTAECLAQLQAAGKIPPVLTQILGKTTGYEGANCYQSALLAHYPFLAGRHVNRGELVYYLKRDFAEVAVQKAPFDAGPLVDGDVLFFDSDDHAGYFLGRGLVFDRPAWQFQYAYRAVALAETHTGMLPEIGGDPFDRLRAVNSARPFSRLNVHRRITPVPERNEKPLSPPARAWKSFFDLGNATLRVRFEPGERRHLQISLLAETALRRGVRLFSDAVNPSGGRAASIEVNTQLMEAYHELDSRLDGYHGFIKQFFFSSVHMNDAKYERTYRQSLMPSQDSAEDRAILTAFLTAIGKPSDAKPVSDLIAKGVERYPRVPDLE